MQRLFAPSLLRALVSRNVLVSVVALVVVVGVAIYESNQLILAQFADESLILAEVANSEITDTTTSAVRAAQLLASLPTTQVLTSTVKLADITVFPTIEQVDSQSNDLLIEDLTVNNTNYYGIFRVIRSERQNPGLLAVLVPTASVEQAQRTLIGILILVGLA